MFAETLVFEISSSPAPRGLYVAPAKVLQAKGISKVTIESQDLAALMLAVRDRQDMIAFAALFRHFAPRVKGLRPPAIGACLIQTRFPCVPCTALP